MKINRHFTCHPSVTCTYPCTCSNQITKEYYDFLVGNINAGLIKKTVCCLDNVTFGVTSYYLISQL